MIRSGEGEEEDSQTFSDVTVESFITPFGLCRYRKRKVLYYKIACVKNCQVSSSIPRLHQLFKLLQERNPTFITCHASLQVVFLTSFDCRLELQSYECGICSISPLVCQCHQQHQLFIQPQQLLTASDRGSDTR